MRVCALTLLCIGVTAAGAAQPLSVFSDLPQRVNTDDRVVIRDAEGRTWKGRVESLTSTELGLRRDGDVWRFQAGDVREVAVLGDGLTNGILIGFGIGAAAGFVAAVDFSGERRIADGMQGAVMLGGICAGLGGVVDALFQGKHVVFSTLAAPVGGGFTSGRGARLSAGATILW